VGPALALPLFGVSLAVTLLAARTFARRLDHLGVRFGFPEALIGLITALAADGPEISAALFALAKGAPDVSVGVLVGSNAFNLAAMLGISGVLAGSVLVSRGALLLEGAIGVAITLLAAAVLLRWLGAVAAALAAAGLLLPYLWIVVGGLELAVRRRKVGTRVMALARALAQRPQRERTAPPASPTHHVLALVVADVALIIAGSAGMVQSALALGDRAGVSRAVLGVLVLAPLTSIPNAITGVRLGLASRSAALVGETFNSNTINLGGGVIAPALFTSLIALTGTAKLELAWLLGMTAVTVWMLWRRAGMGRAGAALLIVLYLGFVVVAAASP
jgi:cation:H+ antiporter